MKAMLGMLAAASLAAVPLAASAQSHGYSWQGSHGGSQSHATTSSNSGYRTNSYRASRTYHSSAAGGGLRFGGGYQTGGMRYGANIYASHRDDRDRRFDHDRGGRAVVYGFGYGYPSGYYDGDYAYDDGGYYGGDYAPYGDDYVYDGSAGYYDGGPGDDDSDQVYGDDGQLYYREPDDEGYSDQGYGRPSDQNGYDQGYRDQGDDRGYGYDDQARSGEGYSDQGYQGGEQDDWSAGAPPADCGRWVWRSQWNRDQWVPKACAYQ
jgi:hypothetical protein